MLNLTDFKKGDRIRRKDGDTFSNGSHVATVNYIEDYNVWIKETFTYINAEEITLANPPTKTGDNVHQPNHYTQGGIETFDILKAKLTPAGYEGYLAGNILKYMTRYEHKNGLEDLQKAKVYLDKLIDVKQGG